jgi:hypothetical protein
MKQAGRQAAPVQCNALWVPWQRNRQAPSLCGSSHPGLTFCAASPPHMYRLAPPAPAACTAGPHPARAPPLRARLAGSGLPPLAQPAGRQEGRQAGGWAATIKYGPALLLIAEKLFRPWCVCCRRGAHVFGDVRCANDIDLRQAAGGGGGGAVQPAGRWRECWPGC